MSALPIKQRSQAEACRFCARYCVPPRAAGDAWDAILDETDNLVVVPSKGSLVPGWLLVIPKSHVLSMLDLPSDQKLELARVLDSLRSRIRQGFGIAPTIFEHGATKAGTAFGCGIDHAHAHVAPLAFDLLSAANAIAPALSFTPSAPPWEHVRASVEYLCVVAPDESSYVSYPREIQSQFFRRAIAHAIGTPREYDYDVFPGEMFVQETVRAMRRLPSARRMEVPAVL